MSEATRGGGKGKLSLGAILLALLAFGADRLGLVDLLPASTESAAEAPGQPRTKPESSAPRPKPSTQETPEVPVEEEESSDEGIQTVIAAERAQRSGFMVEVTAPVERTLSDDNEGSRHQRFILRLTKDLTVLVAHNIDLAPRVPLEEGDRVTVFGQYEWNDRGGVLHWTHHDPGGRHEEGWIRHAGKVYE